MLTYDRLRASQSRSQVAINHGIPDYVQKINCNFVSYEKINLCNRLLHRSNILHD